jgi:uncharacterized membrane protein
MKDLCSKIKNAKISVDKYVANINNSKIFAGLMIIILNITSKFVNFRFSKSVERYLKYTFSKQILVFAIAWMGTRDIYMALIVTFIFIICMDYLFNEDSALCCLPNYLIENLKEMDDDDEVPEEDAQKAQEIIDKFEKQKKKKELKEEEDDNLLLSF